MVMERLRVHVGLVCFSACAHACSCSPSMCPDPTHTHAPLSSPPLFFASAPRRVQLFNGDGSPQALYSAYSDALGVKTVAWSAGGELLAVGSYDEVGGVWQGLQPQGLYQPCMVRA